LPDEDLATFKRYVARLFSVPVDDPNLGVALASDAIGAVHAYAADAIPWSQFVARADAILKAGGEGPTA